MNSSSKRYVVAFLISAGIFITALLVSMLINDARLESIRVIEENIATDTLSLETQFDLLSELSCADIRENSVLSREVSTLSRRLSYEEGRLGAENEEVVRLKRQYSLLLIKDILLMKKISQKCSLQPVFVLYFYSNSDDCPDCERQGYVLTALGEAYPKLRVYSFDYHLDLPALQTLATIYDLSGELPALVVNEKAYYGFKTVEELEEIIPHIETLQEATSTSKRQN
jgi:hypothetical protein